MTLQELTMNIAGKKESRFVLLAARPTMGKSSIALGMALELASQGKKVAFMSCTEKKTFMTQHLEFINRGPLSEAQGQNIMVTEPAAFTISDIKEFCDNGPDAIFIDSLQGLNKENGSLADLQKSLKDLAGTLNCPVVLLSGLTAKADKRLFHNPGVKDLADAEIDESLFDEVMIFYRESYYNAKASRDDCTIVFKNKAEKFVWSDVTNCIM